MQRFSLYIRYKCRLSILEPTQWPQSVIFSSFRRHRSGGGAASRWEGPRKSFAKHSPRDIHGENKTWVAKPAPSEKTDSKRLSIKPQNIAEVFQSGINQWSESRPLHQRLCTFGIPSEEIRPLLQAFVSAVQQGQLSTPEGFEKYGLIRFSQDMSSSQYLSETDVIYSTILFTWASDPAHESALAQATISSSTIATIQLLAQAADRSYPAEEFPMARKMHRKIIMHVGPTNSGKTHHALRALAASKTGVYAGPLRLLAYEIWERLNLGQIVPLGVEEELVSKAVEIHSTLDMVAPSAKKLGNPKYARACNMVTGEEQKIVEDNAGLLSCTVEMLSPEELYDVAVIDEIQMISDEQRGDAWTSAVLGVRAREVHLCGELTAVPLIRELLKETGDELIVREYQRLTPLAVEEQSLDGDFGRVRKGDCIVTFSRSNIFAIKRLVEEKTGLRCAVVYGKLPPEIRSEQAAFFNDPDSGYDVIIGSDAIGMGLNLKIRRIIFEAVSKWDGTTDRFLSVSQVKQIAGRAGRYGLHGNEEPGGFATTMCAPDLPFLRKTLDIPPNPLQYARMGPKKESFTMLANVLPPGSSTLTVHEAHAYIARLPPAYRYTMSSNTLMRKMCDFIDTRGRSLTVADRLLHLMAPIPWREDAILEVIAKFIRMYSEDIHVDLLVALAGTQFMPTMLRVETQMAARLPPPANPRTLEVLEGLHKIVVLYIWMSFRNAVAYSNHKDITELKGRVEVALEWTLRGMSNKVAFGTPERPRRSSPRSMPYQPNSNSQESRSLSA
ncbi:P-loop containing nucleoside triphosphate hydrolase protein [Collybia nuda]|uniref:RNA helicase n=1 Tax=Collybia nuda TaxID=64659 RepID=A0A9P5Y004_9AGAR|nr:P-loop containing nucleoside triphosphate hydrolase protein [Collybia nuda]